MHTTPVSLLQRLRQPGAADAWERFVRLYTPLLFFWARRLGCQDEDAADLVQEVFAVLVEKLPGFIYDPKRSFRSWLRTVALNKFRDGRRGPAARLHLLPETALAAVPAPNPTAAFEEAEYRDFIVGRALRLMQADFRPTTWKACWEHGVRGRPAAEVAAELGLSEGAVFVATSRILRRLRAELEGLLD
jgi:RNA polymerase sigma-70 factor (ECF subfamily)